jgi:drug/metabolite transporter (DMT)-like permease
MLFLSVCCSVVSYFLSGYALTYLSVARASVFANLTTAVSVFAGAVLLREPFTWQGGLCCLLILLGIYGVQKTAPKAVPGTKE